MMKKRLGCLWLVLLLVIASTNGAWASGKNKQEEDPEYLRTVVYAQAWIRELWKEVVQEAAEDGRYLFVDAMEDWLAENVKVESSDEIYVTTFYVPNFEKAGTDKLPGYKGEEALPYLRGLAQSIVENSVKWPKGASVQVESLTDVPAEALDELKENMRQSALLMDTTWMEKVLKATKADSALSRLLLDDGYDADFWKKVDFTKKAQAPSFGAGYRLLKKGSSGAAVKKAQEALIDQGYLDTKADSSYGNNTVAAVEAFERAENLTVDGELSAEDQSILYQDPPPLRIASAIQEEALSDGDSDRHWAAYLRELQDVLWAEGSHLSFGFDTQIEEDALYDEWLALYLAAETPKDAIDETIVKNYTERKREKVKEGEEVPEIPQTTAYIPMDLFLTDAQDAQSIVGSETIAAMASQYATLGESLDRVIHRAWEYADNNLEPMPMPKNSFLTKPKSGSSQLAVKNNTGFPLYVRVYRVQSESDFSTDELVATAFIADKKSASMKMEPGYYHLHYASGTSWYGEVELFGPDGFYRCPEESDQVKKNYRLTITLNPLEYEQLLLYQALVGMPIEDM